MRLIRILKNDIAREAAEWVDDNIISEAQAENICQRYDVDYHQIQNHSLGYNVLVGLGYLFMGLAIITLLSANWDEIPRAVRMGGLIFLTIATHGAALRRVALRKNMATDKDGATNLFLLGNLFFGASIILIAQIYHLGEHMPDGVFWWALGCLPFAILLNSPAITLQSILLAILWFLIEVEQGFYPMLLPLFIIGSLIVLYRGKQSILLFLSVVTSIGLWIEYTLAEIWRDSRHFEFQSEHLAISVSLFILTYAFSHWLIRRDSVKAKDYGSILALWSLRFGLILLLVMSFKEPWLNIIDTEWKHQVSMFSIVAILSSSTLYLAYQADKLKPVISIILFYLLTLISVVTIHNDDYALYYQVTFNLILIATGIWLIVQGIHRGISHYFFLGITAILITAFMRYIDLVGDYIGGAILFMVFAVLLLGAARYWKNYKTKGKTI